MSAERCPCCESNSVVYQSPIELYKSSAYKSHSTLKCVSKEITYHYSDLNFNVTNPITFENNDSTYELQQFHFHSPSEHVIEDVRYDAELHFVFQNETDITVLAFMVKLSDSTSKLMKRLMKNKPIKLPKICKSHYSYPGSLTTPDPSYNINVNWLIFEERIHVEDLEFIHNHAKGSRMLHDRNGRIVVYTS